MFRLSHKNCNNLWSSPWCCFQLSSGLWFHGKVLWDSKERLKLALDLPRSSILDALYALYAFMLLCAAAGRIFPGSVAEAKAGALIFAFGIIVLISNFLPGLSTSATQQRDGPFLKARVSVVEVYHTKPTSSLKSGAEGWGSDNWPWQIPWLPHHRKKAPLLCKDSKRIVLIRSCFVWNVTELIQVDL